VAGDTLNRAGAVSVTADNTTSLTAKAWSGSYSSQGNGIGASIAAAISNDSYTASIGNSATINAASVDVHATNERVDDIFSTINTLAQPVTTTLSDINADLTANANNAASLVSDVNSASAASDAVSSFKAGFADQITSDKKKILDSLKTTAALARDLPLLGSNNFYTEVVAGAASGSKLAVSGGMALQIMLEHTTASIGTGAHIDATGAVTLAAHDNAVSRTLVGTLSASGGSSAAGISLGIVVNSGGVDAHIGSNSTISQSTSIGVTAGAQHEIDLFEVSAAAADANGIAGILGVVYSQASVSAQTGAGSSLKSSGAVNVAATNSISSLNLAGGIAVGGNNGIGGVAISTTVNNTATATIDSNSGAATTVDAGSVSVSAQTAEKLISVGVAGAAAGSNAIAGVATPLVQLLNTEASIGANATIKANAGDVSVTADDATLLINVGGVIAIGGSNGVGGSAAVGVLTDTIKAGIGDDATIDATGAVIVTANAKETVSDDVVSGTGGGNVGVAVAIASSVIIDKTSATIGQRDKVGTIIRPNGVRVAADDTSLVVDLAGTIGAGGGTGVGAGVDANVLTKTTTATIDSNAVVKSSGDVVVQATSAETVFSLVAGFAAGGDAGVAGSVGAFVLTGNTLATVAGGADVRADGNVGVIANDADELDRLVGSGAVGGTAGVGGAIGVSVALQNTKAIVSDDASVEGLGFGGTLGVTTGIPGSFSNYGADSLAVTPSKSNLSGTLGNDVNALTVADGLVEGGSLFVLQRKTTPVVQQVRGVAVVASATSGLRSLAVSGSVAGTAGISISGDVPVVVSDTEATIGARAMVNNSSGLAPGANQSVTVAASSDLYHLGIAGSVAVGGTAGVGAGAETTVFNNTTIASIGAGSNVSAARDVAVTAKASENFAGAAVSAAAGGTVGVAGGISGFVSINKTTATIDSSATSVTHVSAIGNVVVDAEDQTRAIVTGGTVAIGGAAASVGIGIGLAVVIKDTEAEIGASADVRGLGNGIGNDLYEYTGADFSSSRSGRGVLVQANSGESVTGIVIAGAGGLYAGIAGAMAAEVFVDQTRASIDQGATINGSNGGANANQDVTVTARDSTVVSTAEGTVAVGLAGIGGAVDVAVITDATSSFVGDSTTINSARYMTVDALTNRQTSSTVASIAGGLAGVGAAISVLAVANGPNADQTSKTDSNGSFTDSANQKLSDNTIDSQFLSSSSNSNVRGASTQAQSYKSTLNLQPTLPTGIAPGNSATVGRVTVNAGSDVNVRARDVVNAAIVDGAVTFGVGGGAGIGVAVVDVNNTATVTNGASITAGALDVSALSDRTLNGYGVAATAVGVAAALVSLTDTTTTTASIGGSTVSTGGSAQVHATNNEQITIATATLAAGAAGGLSLVVVNPDTEARIDGASTITAATVVNGDAEVTSNNIININSGAAGVAFGGGGVGLTVVVELPTAIAMVGAGDTITSGVTGASATAGDVLVSASTQESMLSLGAGASLGDGIGGALSIVTRTETTNAEVEAATITATGNVGVVATSTSADDLAIGGAAVGGGAGIGGSLGVTVLSSSVTASIDANADVTALGLGADMTYIKAYQTNFSAYGSGDTIKAATLEGVSGGADVQMPVTTGDVRQIGADLLLKKGTVSPTTATGRGVVVNAAKAQSIRSIAVSGGLGGLAGVGLSGDVPVISDTTTATIGANAQINQRNAGSAGPLQSAIVAATSDTYSLNIVGAIAGGGAAGIGASVSTAIVSNTTNATIGQNALVSAKNNVAVTALAAEDFAMIAAAGAAGGVAGIAGGLSLISIDDHTKALIDQGAVVVANNDVVVAATDITREATFAGSIVLSGGAGIGAAVSVALISKETDAVIDANARVSGLAKGSDSFKELTGADATTTRNGQGVLVEAESAESAYVFALGAGGAGVVAAAGAIAVEVFNTNTFATINSGAVINGAAGGSAQQDLAVTARDLTGIVSMNHGIAISGVASLAGGVDVGVLNSNVGASIGDATVSAGRDVLVNAVASKAIDFDRRQRRRLHDRLVGGRLGVFDRQRRRSERQGDRRTQDLGFLRQRHQFRRQQPVSRRQARHLGDQHDLRLEQ
jgi:mucin-19